MRLFRKHEVRADTNDGTETVDQTLRSILLGTVIDRQKALQVPMITSAIDLIGDVIASTPIRLFEESDGEQVKIVKDEVRIKLLNDETGDTLDANQFWKAMITDYFLGKGGYAFIHKEYGDIASIHYVEEKYISVIKNYNPIFKDYDILINGVKYKPYQFIKILRHTSDGCEGKSIISDNSDIIATAYDTLQFQKTLVKKGGNKKGFLTTTKKITKEILDKLKEDFRKLYTNGEESVVVLNEGIQFQESSNTSVEMQLKENRELNNKEIGYLFHMSTDIASGKASDTDMSAFIKLVAKTIMKTIETALNRDFLLESEKKSRYWAFDTKEIMRGSMKERFEAYKIGVDSNVLQIDEARYMEDMEPLGINFVKLGLQDVLYDPKTNTVYTPNTGQTSKLDGKTMIGAGEGANKS